MLFIDSTVFSYENTPSCIQEIRAVNENTFHNLSLMLLGEDWGSVHAAAVNEKWNSFYNMIYFYFNESCTYVNKRVSSKNSKG